MKKIIEFFRSLFGIKKKPPVVVIPKPVEPPTEKPEEKPVDIPIPEVKPVEPLPKSVWPDRSPIGMIMLAEFIGDWGPEDRKWKLAGAYQFSRDALMIHAEESIKWIKYVGAQGMITWNIEGEQWWKPISYIGDPRVLAPEMEPFIDEYFDRFKTAGLKVGVCLRPDQYVPLNNHIWAHHLTVLSHFEDLKIKTKYAKERWGCTIFYVDSNKLYTPSVEVTEIVDGVEVKKTEVLKEGVDNTMGHGGPIPVDVFTQLRKEFPDCLFIPEHYYPDYFPVVPIWAKGPHIEPNAVVVGEVRGDMEVDEFVKAGNIPLFEAWWYTPIIDRIKQAYQNKKS